MISYRRQKGPVVKPCPCSPGVISCGYYNLNLHSGCVYECTYCILQVYLESKKPIYFTDIKKAERELTDLSKRVPHLRIGSGELSDSLALDTKTHYSIKILKLFEKFPHIIFEFKTKSADIANIIKFPRVSSNIVMSWSLNPQFIINSEEHKTPALNIRLQAMSTIAKKGYKIGIHFDPLILFAGWQNHYHQLIKTIKHFINPEILAWWSLGALRFPTALKEHIFKFKDSLLFTGELIPGMDGKYRYFKPLRIELFHFIKREIQSLISSHVPLYLCMEDIEVWREILPGLPPDSTEINSTLYKSVLKC